MTLLLNSRVQWCYFNLKAISISFNFNFTNSEYISKVIAMYSDLVKLLGILLLLWNANYKSIKIFIDL